jgi:hypothetical protein
MRGLRVDLPLLNATRNFSQVVPQTAGPVTVNQQLRGLQQSRLFLSIPLPRIMLYAYRYVNCLTMANQSVIRTRILRGGKYAYCECTTAVHFSDLFRCVIPLCASKDRKTVLAVAPSRYGYFYRADSCPNISSQLSVYSVNH